MAWKAFFEEVSKKDYTKQLKDFLDYEYAHNVIYPPRDLIFSAFKMTRPQNLKVVIIGQDPYHEPGQAMGMSFSVPKGTILPPSLVNIYKEIQNELHIKMKNNGDLTYLAKQGVLLLNAYLTVEKGRPLSHRNEMYDMFFLDVLSYIDKLPQPIVILLWGSFAQKFAKNLANPKHLVLKCAHPSPLSANRGGWFGNGHFTKTNEYLLSHFIVPIDWQN
ncbi:MAG: uracil-DNA glycosylase [Bacilli bacterium]|jgi:uracil-DNA glycosylase